MEDPYWNMEKLNSLDMRKEILTQGGHSLE